MSIQFKFHYNRERIKDTLHEDQSTFSITSRSFLLRMKSISDKSCRETRNTHFMFNDFFFFENRAVYKIMWKIFLERGSPQMTIWRRRIACWVPTATNAHTVSAILLDFHCNNGCTNVSQCYDICTFPFLLDVQMADMPLRSVIIYQSTRRNISEDSQVQQHCCEKLKDRK